MDARYNYMEVNLYCTLLIKIIKNNLVRIYLCKFFFKHEMSQKVLKGD